MHELPVAESILSIVLKHAEEAQATQITDLNIVIGQLASVIDDSVQFYWDILSKDTIAEGAQLHFQRVPTQMLCLDCNHEYKPADGEMACPLCDGVLIKILKGEEFYLDSIEIKTEDEE
ncbi:MAG: hydrogenase maturation nickel metallochaperone HypA [Anaerolineae bacterium]|nr:hydrogenase maturation nickel metallochaperone HypA [Anaerolineae bacterium]